MEDYLGKLHLGRGEVLLARNEGEVLVRRRCDHVEGAALAVQGPVEAAARLFLHADGAGGVGLGVQIHEKRVDLLFGQCCRQVHGGRGFADAALLVGNGEDSGGHEELSRPCYGEVGTPASAASRGLRKNCGGIPPGCAAGTGRLEDLTANDSHDGEQAGDGATTVG